jgi:alkylhydroperoxidase family enzyme
MVLDYAVCMTRIPTDVPEELFARLRDWVDDEQLVELTATIAQENFRARFNRPFEIGSMGFSEGAYCPLPER